jgi:hypothetical protein
LRRVRAATLPAALVLSACSLFTPPSPGPPPPAPSPGELLAPVEDEEAPPVKVVPDEIIVAAWAEPRRLPEGGGVCQILVRVQKKGGRPYPGVEIRLRAKPGTLYSKSEVLVTNERGMTRDRLTTKHTSIVVLNAGGTRYRFSVPVGEPSPSPPPP